MPLSKPHRLVKKRDFDLVFKNGKSFRGAFIALKIVPSGNRVSRFGFVIPARIIKTAVARNRIRRILSETVKTHRIYNHPGLDGVVMVLRSPSLDPGVLRGDLRDVLGKFS